MLFPFIPNSHYTHAIAEIEILRESILIEKTQWFIIV